MRLMEDKNMIGEALPITNIHSNLPAATHQKSQYNEEQLLEIQNSQKETDKYYAKTSLPVDSLVIKTSIEGGEPSIMSIDVRTYLNYLIRFFLISR